MSNARDEARAILSDPRAPAAERFEAQSLLEREHQPTSAGDLIPAAAFAPVLAAMRDGSMGELLKADGPVGIPGPRSKRSKPLGMQSVKLDDISAGYGGDFVEPPGAVDFETLRNLVEGTPVISAIVLARIKEMMRYCRPSEDGGPGFEIRHVDKEHEASDGEKKQMKLLERFISNGGWEFNPRKRKILKRDTFGTFMAKQLRDSLTFDAAPFETEMRRDKQGIDGFYAVDGASVRLCSERGYRGDDQIFALQVVSGRIATTYDHSQLVYEVRNPRSNLDMAAYGLGETELLCKTVTALLNAVSYNADFFDKNSIPKGLLQIFGDYDKEDLVAFRRHWQQMVKGVENRHGLPVMVAKDKESGATYTPFNSAADEMAFGKWLMFLTSLCCAIYQIDPTEIGFESFSSRTSGLGGGSDTEQKQDSSRSKGFQPLAGHFEGVLSDFLVADFNDEWCFRFVGIEEEDQARAWEAAKLVSTVDEVRAKEGMSPHEDPRIGKLPVNPILVGPAMTFQNPPPGIGDFGADAPELAAPGDDFGADAPPPQQEEPPGDDFGAEPPAKPKAGSEFGKAYAQSVWRIARR